MNINWRVRLSRIGAGAEKLLEIFPHLDPEKPWPERLVGLVAVGAKLANFTTNGYLQALLVDNGYKRVQMESEVRIFLHKLLRDSSVDRDTVKVGTEDMDMYFPDGREGMSDPLLITVKDQGYSGEPEVYTLGDYDPMALFGRLVWERGDSLMLTAKNQRWSTHYSLKPMNAPGAFVGDPSPEKLAQRLCESGDKATRSMLLVGPTGSGKSTLARLVSRNIAGDERTLKVSSDALKMCEPDALIDMLKSIQPNVLLLDDVPFDEEFATTKLLALYEALYGQTKVIITTYMDDDIKDGAEDGSLYWPGMRPGRIDEVFYIKRPSPDHRRQILSHYLKDDLSEKKMGKIVESTELLTGAYLAEVAYRINTYGAKSWKEEVAAVRRTAPLDADAAPKLKPKKKT